MAKKKTKSPSKVKKTGFWETYRQERDSFYQSHPRIRVLLGLFIIAFVCAVGALYYNKNVVYIGLSLDSQYGINYPYVEAPNLGARAH